MKRLAFILALSCAPLAACGTIGGILHPSPSVEQAIAKALTAANVAVDQMTLAVEALIKAGTIHGQTAVTINSILDKANAALDAADAYEKAGNATGVAAQVAAVSALLAEINSIIHGGAAS